MEKRQNIRNPFEYLVYQGEDCVKFQTVGKRKCEVIVDRKTWDQYLSGYSWTAIQQGSRITIKTSINKQSNRIWRVIVENEYDEIDYWGSTIDHINNDPLDNRLSNLRIFNAAILNTSNVASKYAEDDMQYIHKVLGGYKIHYNVAGKTFYHFFGSTKYGSESSALSAAKSYRDKYVRNERESAISEMIRKTRNIEFERGLRDKIAAGEIDEIVNILRKWPGGKFCVSVFRQNQEYHVINVHDGAYSPWLQLSRKVGAVCAPCTA